MQAAYPNLLISIQSPVLTVTLNRPEVRNAVDGPTARALAQVFQDFDADDSLAVAILTGGPDVFCAGADLKAFAGEPERRNPLNTEGDGPMGPSRLQLSKPVIAAVSGHCVAGGLELACWCDLRVADQSAIFGVFCRRFGVPLIDGGTVRLPRLIGMSRAMDMILTGRAVNAEEAFKIGLANRLVESGQALRTAQELALQLSKLPQTCMRNDRLSAYQQWGMDEAEAIQEEFRLGLETLASGETLDGASRFTQGAGRHGRAE
ncbi:crotonase/enoyl-CoA hydratase family protein [Spongiibacter sp. KMU-158]|uniref:Crotonase/enoyl-CoA hydratase family protein n=1 Tax=Spongiibacter pelagi TaxID=2760804 RepID=A0A927C1J4_9GAMM|nr:crotonase/enoyl-CoA hydratase family protein [Spongiibacter pelagi]MBD2859574.1 crotonase/enoyl-CoA hydratase family protein [Spongiibacter pelagi]